MALSRSEIMAQLRGLGYSPAGAQGIVENLQAESGLNPAALNAPEGSFGLAQWRLGRRSSLEAFAAARGQEAAHGPTQVAFLHDELSRSYPGLQKRLQSSTSVLESANAFATEFERPSAEALAARKAGFAKAFGGQTVLAQTGAGDLSADVLRKSPGDIDAEVRRRMATVPGTKAKTDDGGGDFLQSAGRYALGVGRELFGGLTETLSGRAMAAGMENAVAELYDSVGSFANSLMGPDFDWARTPEMTARIRDWQRRNPDWQNAPRPLGLGDIIPEPQTGMGQLVSGVSQFALGMGIAKKVLPFGGYGASAAAGGLAGALAFDPRESDLVDAFNETFPDLRNPVTDFLATDPSDGEALGRFKKAVKTVVPAVATDAAIAGFRVLRASRAARRAAASSENASMQAAKLQTDAIQAAKSIDDAAVLGDPNGPIIGPAAATSPMRDDLQRLIKPLPGGYGEARVQAEIWSYSQAERLPVAEQQRLAATTEPPGGPVTKMQVNVARIDGPEDVKAAMQAFLSDMTLDEAMARQSVLHDSELTQRALGIDPFTELLNHRAAAGKTLPGPVEQYALRQMWAQTADTAMNASILATAEPTVGRVYAASKAMNAFRLVSDEVLGIRTETARAHRQWAVSAGPTEMRAKQLQQLLDTNGGGEFNLAAAQRVAQLALSGDAGTAKAVKFIREADRATKTEGLAALFANNLLWDPRSHVANTSGSLLIAIHQLAERRLGAWWSQNFGSGEITPLELHHSLLGQYEGFKDALRISKKFDDLGTVWQAAISGEGGRYAPGQKFETRPRAIADNLQRASIPAGVARAIDTMMTLPGRSMMVEDEFFKTVAYRKELAALAARQATQEKLTGWDFQDRVNFLRAQPPPALIDAAVHQARVETLTDKPGPLAQMLLNYAARRPWARFVVPFISTPSNIYNYALERSPLAPLSQRWKEQWDAGGANRDLANVKLATGIMAVMLGIDLYSNGILTGPTPKEPGVRARQTAERVLPNAIKIGDRTVDITRLDPVALPILWGSSLAYMMDRANPEGPEGDAVERAIYGVILGTSAQILDRSYLTGMQNLMEALDDPARNGQRFVAGLASGFIPGSTALGWARRLEDPDMRAVDGLIETAMNRIPGVSKDLPQNLDFWARPRDYKSGFGWGYDAFLPWRSKEAMVEPIDKEMDRLRLFPQMPDRRISVPAPDGQSLVSISLRGRSDLYNKYLTLARQGVHDPDTGMNALETLNAMVTGRLGDRSRQYAAADVDQKAEIITRVLSRFDRAARFRLASEDATVRALAEDQATEVRMRRLAQ